MIRQKNLLARHRSTLSALGAALGARCFRRATARELIWPSQVAYDDIYKGETLGV